MSSAICFNLDQSKILSSGNGLNRGMKFGLYHSNTMTPFDAPGKQAFENTGGKGEIAHIEQFLLFPQCFLPVWLTFYHFSPI